MKQNILGMIPILALTFCITELCAREETVSVQLRIRQKEKETSIKREDLIKIQQFILKQGRRETYCNMYNHNPAYHTKNFDFYLNPDIGQTDINCENQESKFHNLTIRIRKAKKDFRRNVAFLDKFYVYISVNTRNQDLTVKQIKQPVTDAIKEILEEIKNKPAGIPEEQKPFFAWIKAIKESDSEAFHSVYSKNMLKRIAEGKRGDIIAKYKKDFDDAFGDYKPEDFTITFHTFHIEQNEGKLNIRFKGKKFAGLSIIKEDGKWKINEF